MSVTVATVEIPVSDLRRAVGWYAETLGFEEEWADEHHALLGAGELTLDVPGGGSRALFVAGGALQVLDDVVTVLSEYAGDVAPAEMPLGLVRVEDVKDYIGRQTPGNPLV